jgi:Domain of unknown function (DUF4432)
MTADLVELAPGVRAFTLSNEHLEVTVLPDKGADIYSLVHRASGVDVLFKAPWGVRAPGPWLRASTSMERWIEAYAGGWQLLLPNGGDECTERDVTWGFHGEAALVPWTVLERVDSSATLETSLFTAPLHILRHFSLDGPVLRVREVVTNSSENDIEVMWSHHPAFGAPLLEAGALLRAGCQAVLVDDQAPGTLFGAGTRHPWPMVTTAEGEAIDLGRVPGPRERRAVLAYLLDFTSGYYAITNPRLNMGVGLRWPLDVFDKAWLWQEVHSTMGWPWFGRAYVVAVEPASSIPGHGLASVRAGGASGFHLAGHSSREVVVEAVLFEGTEGVTGIAEGGAVTFARA